VSAKGLELAGVLARATRTIARVMENMPDVPVYGSLAEMIQSGGVDAVTITTPPQTR
jgi:predicted dehydrogenase